MRSSRKRRPTEQALVAAVKVLDARVRKCERMLGLAKKRIGFEVEARGDVIEQGEDPEVPDECSAGRRGRN